MSKWYGKVGYAVNVETQPGYWEDTIVEHEYFGDTEGNRWKRQPSSDSANDNVNMTTDISIVADAYAIEHCSNIVYAELMGTKWKVSDVRPRFPRLVLTLGGVWNGQLAESTE